jgi:DNA-binding CsgD family transcriptional regulator
LSDNGESIVQSFEDFVERSQSARTVPELLTLFEQTMRSEGFENSCMAKLVDGRIREAYWMEFPEGHLETYLAEGWQNIDPVLAFTARARRPFLWDQEAPRLQLEPAQIALLDECKRAGVHSIVVSPIHEPDGSCNVVGASRRHPEPPDPARVPILQACFSQVWCRYTALTGASVVTDPQNAVALTQKELEVLKWIKVGKSNADISEIMSLSTKTVEYHVGNILRKLGATNRTTAVVIAIQRQLLAL